MYKGDNRIPKQLNHASIGKGIKTVSGKNNVIQKFYLQNIPAFFYLFRHGNIVHAWLCISATMVVSDYDLTGMRKQGDLENYFRI